MATIKAIVGMPSVNETITAEWTLATGDEGSAIGVIGTKTSVQVTGTFTGGAKVTMHGSNNGVDWEALSNEANPSQACEFTSGSLKGVLQFTKYIKPVCTLGSATGLKVVLINK